MTDDSELLLRIAVAAERLADAIKSRIRSLAEFPFLGQGRSRIKSGLRSLIVGKYIVFYIVAESIITVVRAIDARMDVDAEFQR